MEVLDANQMRRVDRRAIEERGIAGLLLMESAGLGVVAGLLDRFPDAVARGTIVLCGKGNNGGDGLVVARHLHRAGHPVAAWLVAPLETLSGDAAVNGRAAVGSGVPLRVLSDASTWREAVPELARAGLLVDALLGTGVQGGARGVIAAAIDALHRAQVPVVAIDLPSGLDADGAEPAGTVVRANHTFTLCRPKPAFLHRATEKATGTWSVVPIGVPDEVVAAEEARLFWTEAADVAHLVPSRPPDAHKGRFGHLLVVAGSHGKSGAGVLAARGALRFGVGLVTVAAPESVRREIAAAQPEAMTETLGDGPALTSAALERLLELAADRSATTLGPGLGRAPETGDAVRGWMTRRRGPAVVDADGLYPFADCAGLEGDAPLILTPHPGEASRLLGRSVAEIQSTRLESARELARRTGAVVALKGDRTVVAAPDGRAAVNASGNPGMATAGTGDVLAGVAGAALAAGLDSWDAARLSVWLHGAAGDAAAAGAGEAGRIAGDVADALPRAIGDLHSSRRARVW